MEEKQRCGWCLGNPLYQTYHDCEWGVPEHREQRLFEFLILESAQAGLSWITILKKRDGYKKAFYNFEVTKVAEMTLKDVEKLMSFEGIVRNKLKINSTINQKKFHL